MRLGLGTLPRGTTWPHLVGLGLLSGIGFTVSLFITGLAFEEAEMVHQAKVGIFAASLVAGSRVRCFYARSAECRGKASGPPQGLIVTEDDPFPARPPGWRAAFAAR